MNTIIIHTDNENQVNLLQSLLKELKINFEIQKIIPLTKLTSWEKKQLEEGIQQADNGEFFSFEESEKILDECFK